MQWQLYLPPGKMEHGRRSRGMEEEFVDRLTSLEGVVGGKVRYPAEGLTGWDRTEIRGSERAVYVLKA